MQDILFYIFAALTLICGFLVVANPFSRNPVTSAMFLVLAIVSMAGLFILLHAFFLAAVQILVYAGAVIVLFLFVIMLLDIREEQQFRVYRLGALLGALVAGAVAYFLIATVRATRPGEGLPEAAIEGSTAALGTKLFTDYLLPFEILAVVLLVAMVGAVLLSKKDLK